MKIDDGLRPGTKLLGGKYTISEAIGQGGFGITYRAKAIEKVQGPIGEMEVEIDVAIKEFFIKSECERSGNTDSMKVPTKAEKKTLIENYKSKFLKEANNISKLNHNNIVKVINVFEENDTAYYVMQYISGKSLEDRVGESGPMSEMEALRIIEQLASAIGYIHARKITHLDIKPSNILIDKSGCLKLIDFGLAKHYDSKGKATSMGLVQGVSEGYSPIEQYEQEGINLFSPQTDIYAIGATMAYLLTGKVPPKSLSMQLPELPSNVSERVKSAIYQAMKSAKHERPATIVELLSLLGGNIPQEEYYFEEKEPISGETEVLSAEKKPFPTKIVVSVVACIVAIVAFFVVNKSISNSETTTDLDTIAEAVEDSVVVQEPEKQVVQQKEVKTVEKMSFKTRSGDVFTYTGPVINGVPNGKGTGVYSTGTYVGEYKDGIRNGKAIFTTSGGANKFEGRFANDEYSQGRLTLSDGYYFEGAFKKGQPYNGGWYTKNGKLDSKIVNGKY